jgi:hypothetical protein
VRDLRGSYLRLQTGEKLSEYIIRQVKARRIFIGCEGGEPLLAPAVEMVGNESFMCSTDFPHEVNAVTCKKELEELVGTRDYRTKMRFCSATPRSFTDLDWTEAGSCANEMVVSSHASGRKLTTAIAISE